MKNENNLLSFICLGMQVVKEHYQNAADIGPITDLGFYFSTMVLPICVEYSNTTDGWSIDYDKQCQKVCKIIIFTAYECKFSADLLELDIKILKH